jgi:hypothetical protein
MVNFGKVVLGVSTVRVEVASVNMTSARLTRVTAHVTVTVLAYIHTTLYPL